MPGFHIVILTIPRNVNRLWFLLGHLSTIGFDVLHRVDICIGYDILDFLPDDLNRAFDMMVIEGHTKYEPMRKHRSDPSDPPYNMIFDWGKTNILHTIVEKDCPTLVLEDDVFFNEGITQDFLFEAWESLVALERYKNINAVQLMFYEKETESNRFKERHILDDVWARGIKQTGGQVILYTPHGAEKILEQNFRQHDEMWIYHSDFPGLYSSVEPMATVHNSPVRNLSGSISAQKGRVKSSDAFFEPIDLHSFMINRKGQ